MNEIRVHNDNIRWIMFTNNAFIMEIIAGMSLRGLQNTSLIAVHSSVVIECLPIVCISYFLPREHRRDSVGGQRKPHVQHGYHFINICLTGYIQDLK